MDLKQGIVPFGRECNPKHDLGVTDSFFPNAFGKVAKKMMGPTDPERHLRRGSIVSTAASSAAKCNNPVRESKQLACPPCY